MSEGVAKPFVVHVAEVFRLGDGRTVFVGTVDGGAPFIGSGRCRLLVGETIKAIVDIEGEMMLERRHQVSGPTRSVSTTSVVALAQSDIDARRVRLVQVEP